MATRTESMSDIEVNVSEAQAAYRSVFLIEALLRLLARALIARNGFGVGEVCERVLGRRGRHPAPLPMVEDRSQLSTLDELNYLSLGDLSRIIFEAPELQPMLKSWLVPADAKQLRAHIEVVQQLRNALAHFWPLRFTPDRTAPLRTLSALLVPMLMEAGIDDPEFQRLRRLHASQVDFGSSRRLDHARQGIPHPTVASVVTEHLLNPDPETRASVELASVLAHTLQLRQTITFRSSTTQMFRAALECVAFHSLGHPPRAGEEGAFAARLIAPGSRSASVLGKVVYSDVDHPAMQYTVQAMWKGAGGGTTRVALADLVFGDGDDPLAAVLERYREAVRAGGVSVVLVPHVVWINGAVLDVRQICAAIREIDPLVVTVVDGAQAVGHIPLDVEDTSTENEDIDFYLGCGQKWLAGPEAVGFGRVGRRFERECLACLATLASGEAVTDASGLSSDGAQTATQLRGLARGLMEALRLRSSAPGGFEVSYRAIRDAAEHVRAGLASLGEIQPLEPPRAMRSGIVSVTGGTSRLRDLHQALASNGFHATLYALPPELRRTSGGREFLRLSPGPRMSADDLAAVHGVLGVSE